VPVRGLLLDAGGVLIGPVGGRWNPRFDFESVVERRLPDLPRDRYPEAFAAGQRLLDAATGTAARADYHRAILRVLGVDRPDPALLAELEQPSAAPPVEPYPEVPAVLDELRARGVLMAVVSDSWPDLADLLARLGLRGYFDALVISALLGCRKPDPRMYRAGSDGLGLAPADCLFVDDDPELVRAAVALGYQGLAVVRAGQPPADLPWIATLADLVALTR